MEDEIKKIKVNKYSNQTPSTQTGNYCWLIAGVETLLSCGFFVKFVHYYHAGLRDTENLLPMCILMREYLKKNSVWNLYGRIERILFDSFDIGDFGEAEDMNVVFLYFEKSAVYKQFFGPYTYVVNDLPVVEQKYKVYAFRKYSAVNLKTACDQKGVFAYAIKGGGHYEVFQRYVDGEGKTFFGAKNTNWLGGRPWDILVVFCVSGKDVYGALYGN
jgi:hypothetical protein